MCSKPPHTQSQRLSECCFVRRMHFVRRFYPLPKRHTINRFIMIFNTNFLLSVPKKKIKNWFLFGEYNRHKFHVILTHSVIQNASGKSLQVRTKF